MVGHGDQRIERQPVGLFDAKRRVGARLDDEPLLLAAIEVGSHVDERLDELLSALLQARHLDGGSDLVGQDGKRPSLGDGVDASPCDAHHADHLAAGLQWRTDVVVQAMIWDQGGSSGRIRRLARGRKERVDLVAGHGRLRAGGARVHVLAVAGLIDQADECDSCSGQVDREPQGQVRQLCRILRAGHVGGHRLKCVETVPERGLCMSSGLQFQEPALTPCRFYWPCSF